MNHQSILGHFSIYLTKFETKRKTENSCICFRCFTFSFPGQSLYSILCCFIIQIFFPLLFISSSLYVYTFSMEFCKSIVLVYLTLYYFFIHLSHCDLSFLLFKLFSSLKYFYFLSLILLFFICLSFFIIVIY